ncbi:MAG: hypothetical protein IJ894_08730 [Bacteroidales bacterium]|nr:hypothetical protein [Bacteroidales bacterium]
MNIYIANLSVNVTDEDLRELFSPYGTINSVKVIIDKETGKSKGFGFVEMPNEEEGQNAIDALNESEIEFAVEGEEGSVEKKVVKVSVARPRQQNNNQQGGFRQQNNNGGFQQRRQGGLPGIPSAEQQRIPSTPPRILQPRLQPGWLQQRLQQSGIQ